jgi:hypothetical protein
MYPSVTRGIALGPYGGSGFKQTVQLTPFAEHGCFRAVQVFGVTLVEYAATETDGFALDVPDREHDPVPEAVIPFGLPLFARLFGGGVAFPCAIG